ncbi:DUF2007 domain-containing protein [Marinobacter sp. F3R11]|uniref:putative signal transducing protein n=1 Tax=Marinobacter sp. F3R11 TaxID=2267231 RepID=UPI000DEAD292|nr:DUF2007 domain-containing protein [Marinobacter sp. F3R11]RBW50665.1 DUF2007 domain-containing protein [Marinobacter sp. F3R11]
MQIAYKAGDITEAHIVAGLLNAHNIETYVGGHYLQGAMGEIGTTGFSNVHVEDEDLYQARQLIAEYEANECAGVVGGSEDDKPDSYARWFLLIVAVLVLVWLNF